MGILGVATIAQLYFGSRYRSIFLVDKTTLNKSYFSMIRELLLKHPLAGKIYLGIIALQIFAILALSMKSKIS